MKVNKLLIVVPSAHLVKLVLSPKYVKAQFSQEWLNYFTTIIKSQAKQVTKWLQVSAARLVDGWNCQSEPIIFHTQKKSHVNVSSEKAFCELGENVLHWPPSYIVSTGLLEMNSNKFSWRRKASWKKRKFSWKSK